MNEAAGGPVLVLAAWLFYRRSHLIDELYGPGRALAASLVWTATLGLFAWGTYTGAPDLQLASVIGWLFGGLLMWGGGGAVRAFWIPTLFLVFALPISPVLIAEIIWPVQLATAKWSGFLLNAIGVDSLVQGDQILRPENTFIVIETCSGLRSVVTLTMLTILLIDLFERRGLHAGLLLLLAPVVALLTNGFRVVSLVLNPHSDIASIHSLQGIVMLLVGLSVIYAIDLALGRALGTDAEGAAAPDYGRARTLGTLTPKRVAALAAPALVLLTMIALSGGITPYDATRALGRPVGRPRRRGPRRFQVGPEEPELQVPRRHPLPIMDAAPGSPSMDTSSICSWGSTTRRTASSRCIPTASHSPTAATPSSRSAWSASRPRRQRAAAWSSSGGRNGCFPTPGTSRHRASQRNSSVTALALDRSPFARPAPAVAIRLASRISRGESEADVVARLARVHERIRPVLDALGAPAEGGLRPLDRKRNFPIRSVSRFLRSRRIRCHIPLKTAT